MRKIIFYEMENGVIPVKDFLDSLSDKVLQKISWVLKLVTEIEFIPKNYFKKLISTDDIWECRIIFGSNIYRILCFFQNDNIVVLTNGFIKKTQRTPKNEIELAEKYKNDYIRRIKDGSR